MGGRLHRPAKRRPRSTAESRSDRGQRRQRQPGHPHPQLPPGRRGVLGDLLNGQAPRAGRAGRTRFNEANDSHYYLVPGVIVTIMTMIGALLTSLVMAREYERARWKASSSRPAGGEILAAKAAPTSCWAWSAWPSP
ncbi:MAG: hypothetical protein ACLT8E_04340 [Akkermansia sp.]